MKENDLMRKLRLTSKFMTSESGEKIITIRILPIISKSKCNQTMEFGQFIKYNLRRNVA